MVRLTAGVIVAHPETGEPVFLPEGSDAPEWADGLLGAHVLDEAPAALDEKPQGAELDEDKAGRPAGNASEDVWREYALANGKSEDELKGLGRNEIRDLFA